MGYIIVYKSSYTKDKWTERHVIFKRKIAANIVLKDDIKSHKPVKGYMAKLKKVDETKRPYNKMTIF
jgi:hypothetical protein